MSSDFIMGIIVALLLIGIGYWLGRSKKSSPSELDIHGLKIDKRAILRELCEHTEQIAVQSPSERDRHKVRLQEVSVELPALDKELGSPTQRRHK